MSSAPSRPLRVLVVAADPVFRQVVADGLGERGEVDGMTWDQGRLRALTSLRRTLRSVRPDIVILEPNAPRFLPPRLLPPRLLPPRLLASALRAGGWRTVVAGASDEAAISARALALAAGRPGAGLHTGPAFSVISTVFNEGDAVDDLIKEVLAQLEPGDELVIADGGSTDGTLRRLRRWEQDIDALRVVEAPGANIATGRNEAIRASTRGVIACADAGCHPGEGWLASLRVAFAEDHPTWGLAAGVPLAVADTPLQMAQVAACYPDAHESRHPTLVSRLYATLFGTGFRPQLPYARCLAFTRDAWERAGGFPEHLGWVEDAAFGRAVSRDLDCVLVTDADVWWEQRPNLASTFRMYKTYGVGSYQSGSLLFVGRDVVRAVAYFSLLIGWRRPRLRVVLGLGMGAYMSVPLQRLVRRRAPLLSAALVPVALATKDLGKVWGELSAATASRRGR